MKNIKSLLLVTLLGASFTSCNDFLNLEPLNDIVLENFWTDKSDVESVLLGAYSALEQSDCLTRMCVWGEMRSDNVVEGNGTGEDIRQILRENILITNSYCKYTAFYDVINRANTVLYYAPQVADKDPNFLIDELLAQEAEAVALRCLCYWYLIRSFHDVPYVTEPSIDDEGGRSKFYVPQSSFEAVLDSIIKDLESVKKYAVNKYASEDANTGRITKSAICAMLADMYLWRGNDGDWDKCIAVCEEVNTLKMQDYEKIKSKEGRLCTLSLFNGYPLISDAESDEYFGHSYDEIFGTGNSFESLFELPYSFDVQNPFVGTYYQSYQSEQNRSVGQIKAYQKIGDGFSSSAGNEVFESPFDSRYFQNLLTRGTSYAITKYAYSDIDLRVSSGTLLRDYYNIRGQYAAQPNWIVYRYSEVLLFEAEAYIMKAKAAGDGSAEATTCKEKAYNLIDAVNKRAIIYDVDKVRKANPKTLADLNYTSNLSVAGMEDLLFKERRRELMYEGKRWYDLVRMARRDGNQTRLLGFVEKKHDSSTLSAVKIKLKNPYAMYFPLAKDEIRNSYGCLKQNPAYKDDEEVQQASH
ncbi:MAG: RagB/SusD family nutrient uptake outer membrane protein [Bacteroidaceae bacterium]|nr:RagB/SusD family nutrient uptake outer membrane protein [Bacteroidaceae bacterium]